MRNLPEHSISSDEAFQRLSNGDVLSGYHITGDLIVETTNTWNNEVVLENCVIEHFSGAVTEFENAVRFKGCRFKKCQFIFTYFCGGLIIDNCIFDDYLDFQAGGHNRIGKPVVITNNEFLGFVNFFDCWFKGEVTVTNNRFEKGTNLLSSEVLISFDITPSVENNEGRLDINNEGIEIK